MLGVKPLDSLVDVNNIWFMKLDVEGLEYEALKGAKRIIEENHPIILIEQNGKLPAIKKLLHGEYELYYYDLQADKFTETRSSRLNCWLIPAVEYRSSTVIKIIEGRL
jgi:hypothetical protein